MTHSLILSFSNGTKFDCEHHAKQLRIGVMHAVYDVSRHMPEAAILCKAACMTVRQVIDKSCYVNRWS